MNILIVDDEMMIKEWIRMTLEGLETPIELIRLASNGEEALERIAEHRFDLIFIDVMMPGMNGLELLKQINTTSSDAMLIVLSSHDEFKFAKEAIKYNVQEYVLKNECSREKLLEIVQTCEERIEQREHSSGLKPEILQKLINGNTPYEEESPAMYLPAIPEGSSYIISVTSSHAAELPQLFEEAGILIRHLSSIGTTDEFSWELFSLTGESPSVNRIKQHFARSCSERLGSRVSVGRSFTNTSEFYRACRNSWLGYQELFYSDVLYCSGPHILREADAREVDKLCDDTLSEIRSYDEANTIRNLKVLYEYLQHIRPTDVQMVLHIYLALVSTFFIYTNKHSRRLTENLEVLRSQIHSFEHLSEVSDWVISIIKSNARLITRSSYSSSVESALEFIEEHYQSIVSVSEIADHVNLSLDYFSRHFKSEVGVTLNSYLVNFRLDKASVILLSSDLSVQEVAKRVGIESGSYFSKCFKKKYHTQPIRFRIHTKD